MVVVLITLAETLSGWASAWLPYGRPDCHALNCSFQPATAHMTESAGNSSHDRSSGYLHCLRTQFECANDREVHYIWQGLPAMTVSSYHTSWLLFSYTSVVKEDNTSRPACACLWAVQSEQFNIYSGSSPKGKKSHLKLCSDFYFSSLYALRWSCFSRA